MDFSPEIPQPQPDNSAQTPSLLQVDFSWKKFQTLITDHDKPSEPIYTVHCQTLKSPSLIFKSATDDKRTIGTGTLHPVSINASYSIHGRKGTLKALKRWQTAYTHLSHAFSDTDYPVPMTWTSSCGFKSWDFVCLDAQQNAVARFSAKAWAVKKVGTIEFMGPKAGDAAARDEIVVTALTLFYCMMLRTNNILSFFGAVFARPGPLENDAAAAAAESSQELSGELDKEVGIGAEADRRPRMRS